MSKELMMSTEMSNLKSVAQQKAETIQLLTFKLDDQEYALNICHVVEVVRMVALTRPPHAPEYVDGIFNLRGKVIPVIDARKRYGLPSKPHDLDTQLLIAKVDRRMVALAVDAVSEVLTLPMDRIEPPDQIGPALEYLSAVGKVGDRLILILDSNTLLADVSESSREAEEKVMAA